MATRQKKANETKVDANLIKVSEELNTVLGLNPAIDVTANEDVIKSGLKDGALLLTEADEKDVTKESWAWLKENKYIDHIKTAAPAATEKPKRQAPANFPPKRYSRQEALIDAIKAGETNVEKIVTAANELMVKNGSKASGETKTDLEWFIKVITGIGKADVKDGVITFK